MKEDIQHLIGDVRIIVAPRKRTSIGNQVIQNRKLCAKEEPVVRTKNQRCHTQGCLSCQLMCDYGEVFIINGQILTVPSKFNCKTKNVVYCAQCKICSELNLPSKEDTYFGQTAQECHNRFNGHRPCFNEEDHEHSALSTHSKLCHNLSTNLNDFRVMIVSQVSPMNLDREEHKFIEQFKTNTRGINRCKVVS